MMTANIIINDSCEYEFFKADQANCAKNVITYDLSPLRIIILTNFK